MALSLAADGGDADGAAANVAAEEVTKTPRLPRWSRQEILVLIQGKRMVENRVRRGGRATGLAAESSQLEPKWTSVSSYCKRHGVNRGPVQCRKRWSNLAGDYKKIKEWEAQIKEGTESFWVMRNDLRRERKLPGFFDREVFDILESDSPTAARLALALGPLAAAAEEVGNENEIENETEAVFDCGRRAAAEDGLFSDEEMENDTSVLKEAPPLNRVAAPVPISEKVYQPYFSAGQGTRTAKQPTAHQEGGSSSHEARKRKRYTLDDGDVDSSISLQDKLIDVLERNGKMLHSQLEAQNNNLQLDREQRKENAANLVAVLNKLADAMVKISDKL